MEDLGIKIKAILNLDGEDSRKTLNKEISTEINGQIQNIKVGIELDDAQISAITKKINDVISTLSKANQISGNNTLGSNIVKEQNNIQSAIQKTINLENDWIKQRRNYNNKGEATSSATTYQLNGYTTKTINQSKGEEISTTVIEDRLKAVKLQEQEVTQMKKEIAFQEKLNAKAQSYNDTLSSRVTLALDSNTTTPISKIENIELLYQQWEKVKTANEQYRNSTVETATQNEANVKSEIASLSTLIKQIQASEYSATKLRTQSVAEVKEKDISDWKILENEMKKAGVYGEDLKSKMASLRTTLNNITDSESLTEYNIQLGLVNAHFKELRSNNALDISTTKAQKSLDDLYNQIGTTKNRMEQWLKGNPKAFKEYGNNIQELIDKLKVLSQNAGNQNSTISNKSLQSIKKEFQNITSSATLADKTGKSFFATFAEKTKKFAGWYGITGLLMSAKNILSGMISNVISLDTAMTNLYKVTDNTAKEYDTFFANAQKSAKELAVSLSDIINSTGDFARLGYSLPDATELAKVAALYVNVGDGITSDEASKSIISTMKAFNIQADKAETIIDKFNQVGNNFSISSAGIGDALQRSASSLAAANNDLSQSIALTVGANNVVQDPEAVGTMWKTVAMRIRGAKTELESAGEDTDGLVTSTSKLQSMIKGMTGFDILESDQKTFKSTYDIIVGIGKEYSKLSDINKASLLETLAGKRQGNALSAALTNIKDIEKAYQSAQSSAGSAEKENAAYLQSISAKVQKFKEVFESLSADMVNSDLVKKIVDIGTKGLDLFDNWISKVGALNGVVVPLIATILSVKGKGITDLFNIKFPKLSGVDNAKENVQKYLDVSENAKGETELLSKAFNNLSKSEQNMAINAKASGGQIEILTGIEKVSTVASKAMGIALNTALNIGVGILGTQIISAISELVNAEEEARQKAEEEMEQIKKQADTYSENAKSLGEMADEYKKLASQTNLSVDNKKRLAEIQTELIDKYGSEAKGIDLVNGKLDDEYKKINKLSQQDYLKAADNNQTAYEDAISKAKNNTDTDINGSWYQEAYKYDYIQGNFDYKKIDTTTEEKYQKLLASVEGFKRKRLASAGGVASFEVRIDGALDAEQRLKALNEAKEKLISNSTFEERTKANSTVKKMIDSLTSEANKAQDKIDEVTKYAKQEAENLVKGFAFDGKDISNITVTEYKSWVDSLVGQYANKDPKLSQAIVDYLDQTYSDANYKFALMSDSDKSWYMQQKIKADATASSNSNAKTETLTSWLKDNADAIDKVQTKAESLQTTFQSLSKGTITNSELVNLFQDYPQLAKYANDTDKLKGKIQELLKQNPKSLVSSLNKLKNSLTDKTEKQAVQNLIDQLTKLGNVSVDKTTESVTSLADALKDEKEVLDNISTAYSDTEQVVTDYIDAQVEKLNNEKQAVEDSYSDKITKSEASYDNQIAKIQKVIDGLDKVNEVEEKRLAIKEKENDLAEKQNDLAQKQNDMIKAKQRLENAKNNKNVLSYSESRGFYHEANQEDVQSAKDNLAQAKKDTADAKKAVKDAQDAIKQAQTDYTVSRFQEQINVLTAEKEKATKQLEKEQAKRSKAYDTEIKKWDKYKTSWSNLVNSYEQNTKKKIASQVLGTDYEEKLSKRSQTALNNFASNFNSYKDKLNKVENAIAKNEGALYAQRGKEITTYQNKLSNLEATIAKLNSSNISIKTANAVTKAATNVTMKFTDNWKKLNSAMATPTNKTFNINVDKIESNNPEQLYKDFRSIVNKIGNK